MIQIANNVGLALQARRVLFNGEGSVICAGPWTDFPRCGRVQFLDQDMINRGGSDRPCVTVIEVRLKRRRK